LFGPRSLGEVVDMVMYKQGSGLVAGGTIGPQSAGGIMSPQKKPATYSVQSTSGVWPANIPIPGYSYEMNPVEYQASRLTNWLSGGQQEKTREEAWKKTQAAPPMPSAPLMAPKAAPRQMTQEQMNALYNAYGGVKNFVNSPLGGGAASFDELMAEYNRLVPRNIQDRVEAQTAQAPAQSRAEVAAGQQHIGPGFTMPTRSAFEDLVNPYDEVYKGGLMSAAGGRVARQFAPGRERLQQDLAARGISPDSPLFMSMMAQGADREDAARGAAIEQAMLEGAGKQAEFDRFKATGIADYTRAGAELALRQERQPAELRSLAADATVREAEASIAADPATINAKKREIQAKLGMAEAELEAALNFLETTDPNKWWNHPGWRAGGAFVDSVSKVARAIKDIKG
jgi:Trp operon repressor